MPILQSIKFIVLRRMFIPLSIALGFVSCNISDKKDNESLFQEAIVRNSPSTNWIEYNGVSNNDEHHLVAVSDLK